MSDLLAAPAIWDEVAEDYTAEFLPAFSFFAREALALADLPPGASVLDVAAGPGTLALLAASSAGRVTAVDFSREMARILEKRAESEGIRNVEVRVADGQQLPFEDHVFDAGFSMFGLIFFPDRAAGFTELRRVLKPGGRAVVSGWAPLDRVPVLSALFSAIGELLPDVPFGGRPAPLSDVDAFRDEMQSAGFRQVEVRTVEHRIEIPSVRAFWQTQERSSAPVRLLRQSLEPDEWEHLGREVVTRLEREFGPGSFEVAWQARLGTGTA